MLLRVRKFSIPNKYLLDAAVVGFFLVAGIITLRYSFVEEEIPLCRERYTGGLLFTLAHETAGPLSTAELQGRLLGRDWGLTGNAKVVKDAGAPTGYALEVDLRPHPAGATRPLQRASGIGFTWLDQQIMRARSACLSYNVWVPADFKPGTGGVLPGLIGGQADAVANSWSAPTIAFAMRPKWTETGALTLWHRTADDRARIVGLEPTSVLTPGGRWLRVEQEVILNAPEAPNGTLRVWIDGKLHLELKDVTFRHRPEQRLLGVSALVHHERRAAWAPSETDTSIRISPFEVRLND